MEAQFSLTKNQLKKLIRLKMIDFDPDKVNQITNKMIGNTMIFIQGYLFGIQKDIMPPINQDELDLLLVAVGFDYIKDQLN